MSVIEPSETYELYRAESINTERIGMFSGGYDSAVSTHFSFSQGWIDMALYIDTGVGIEANKQYVIDTCEEFGCPLIITDAERILEELSGDIESLLDFAKRLGFPSPKTHNWIYRYLKERSLREIAKRLPNKPAYYTGVRRRESINRMGSVQWKDERDQWVFYAPIAAWSKDMVEIYRHSHSIPSNPVRDKIHRSGDCFCGAYGHREEELSLLEAHYPDLFSKIIEIENAVIEERGEADEKAYWGWGKADEQDLENFPIQCGSCVSLDGEEPERIRLDAEARERAARHAEMEQSDIREREGEE